MESKQVQKAGDGSQQLQMVNPTFNVGITEKRAREIFTEMNEIARQNYTQDAYAVAMKRVGMFEDLLMNKVEQVDGMLEAFRDPSFQFLLVEAQKRAAASDRDSDFEMLADKAMEDPCKPGNPREVSKEDFINLYRQAM